MYFFPIEICFAWWLNYWIEKRNVIFLLSFICTFFCYIQVLLKTHSGMALIIFNILRISLTLNLVMPFIVSWRHRPPVAATAVADSGVCSYSNMFYVGETADMKGCVEKTLYQKMSLSAVQQTLTSILCDFFMAGRQTISTLPPSAGLECVYRYVAFCTWNIHLYLLFYPS